MTSIAMPVTTKISLESSLKVTFRALSASFGDGYSQVAPDGINNTIDTWDIVWGGLTTPEYQTVLAALKSVGYWGTILYTPCDETIQKKFRLTDSISTAREGTTYKVTCTIKQVFGV